MHGVSCSNINYSHYSTRSTILLVQVVHVRTTVFVAFTVWYSKCIGNFAEASAVWWKRKIEAEVSEALPPFFSSQRTNELEIVWLNSQFWQTVAKSLFRLALAFTNTLRRCCPFLNQRFSLSRSLSAVVRRRRLIT
jgi:uncharacterized membrane protein